LNGSHSLLCASRLLANNQHELSTEINMPKGNPTHLLKLANREFKALTEERSTPQPNRKFKAMKLNAARFDQSWDRKRGAAARLTAVVLRENDVTLEHRV
jgi:hypothetical protein